jgi:hypothetical protein
MYSWLLTWRNRPSSRSINKTVQPVVKEGFWWNNELRHFTTSTQWLFNQAKGAGNWESYKAVLTCYKIRKAKRSSRRDYCQGIRDVPDGARLMTIMASQLATWWDLLYYLIADRHNQEKILKEYYML